MKWIDSKCCKNYDKLQQLKDSLIEEYAEWQTKFDHREVGMKFSDRYGTGDKLGWWGLPLIDSTRVNHKWADHWPKSMKILKSMPGVINVCINFIQPDSYIPDHTDDYWDLSEANVGKVRAYGTMIGISMPSTNPEIVGFHVEDEKKGWDTGDIVSFDGLKRHGGWNNSDQWRVTMIIDIKEEYWNFE